MEETHEVVLGAETTRWITQDQLAKLEELIHTTGGKAITRALLSGDRPYGPTVYQLKGDPIMVMNKQSKENPELVGWVFPSRSQLKMINDAGIIDYSDQLGGSNA